MTETTLPIVPLDVAQERLETALKDSPADETEIVWLEIQRRGSSNRGERIPLRPGHERTVLVRVHQRSRPGSHRSGGGEVGDIANAIRLALAQSHLHPPIPGLPHLPHDSSEIVLTTPLFDPEIEALDAESARRLLRGWAHSDETILLDWTIGRVAIANSRGVRRAAEVTAVRIEARCGRRPGAGRAARAARTLAELDAATVVERARAVNGPTEVGQLEEKGTRPVVLSPEATIELVDLLNRTELSARAYREGTSMLRQHLGVQVFDRAINLTDDGCRPTGLAFPFDLEGSAKHRVNLIVDGAPKTPALDERQAALLGLPPTASAVAGSDALAENLFLEPGEHRLEELLAAADGGIWIGWLDRAECYDPSRGLMLTRARGVRRIRESGLAESLPDLRWEESLLGLLARPLQVADNACCWTRDDGLFGGITAPSLGLTEVSGLLPTD